MGLELEALVGRLVMHLYSSDLGEVATFPISKIATMEEPGRWLSDYEHCQFFQGTPVQFPTPT